MSRRGKHRGHNDDVNTTDEDIAAIIKQDDADLLVEQAEAIGRQLEQKGLSSSQIRALFTKVKQLESRGIPHFQTPGEGDEQVWKHIERELKLLRPKMAYAAARHDDGVPMLQRVLDKAIVEIDTFEEFTRFTDFFEAILAYHKQAGGR